MAQLAPKLAAGDPTDPQTMQEGAQMLQAQHDPHDDPLHCTESIYMSFFFDGTRNNKEADTAQWKHSKVERLGQWLRSSVNRLRPTLQAAGIALLLASLAACSQSVPEPAKEETAGLGVGLLNYSDINTGPVYVNGEWAGNVGHNSGGGETSPLTGITLPRRWRPGLTFKLSWSDDVLYAKDPKAMYRRVVTVDPYTIDFNGDGYMWIVFFPDGVIKTVVSSYGPTGAGFPNDWNEPARECRWGHNPACINGKLKPEYQ